jgi:hypothetical protein
MKLHELGAQRQTEQIAKTLDQRLGDHVDFDRLRENQARRMLQRVKGLLREYRESPSRHYSERNPDYLRLMMMEQALVARIREQMIQPGGTTQSGSTAATASTGAAMRDPKTKSVMDKVRRGQALTPDEQQTMNKIALSKDAQVTEKYMGFEKLEKSIAQRGDVRDPAAVAASIGRKKYGKEKFQKAAAAGKKLGESRLRSLLEGELQTAQVVLAAQDMIDRIQKMMEEISEMQFKDLPALTDSIKNDMGVEQSQQFQQQASTALTTLLQSVQAGKTEMESAQGVLTGQAPVVPGADAGADVGMAAGLPPAGDELGDELGGEVAPPEEEEDEELTAVGLGRERR